MGHSAAYGWPDLSAGSPALSQSYPTDVWIYLLGMELQDGPKLTEEHRNHGHRTCSDWTIGFSDLDTTDALPLPKAIAARDSIGLTIIWKYRRYDALG